MDKDRTLLQYGHCARSNARSRGVAMSPQDLEIRELPAWGFDHPVDRGLFTDSQLSDEACAAHRKLAVRNPCVDHSAISTENANELAGLLATREDAVASSGEFDGLVWELAIVDLRKLIAFQRRIGFRRHDSIPICPREDSRQLLDLALPLHAHSRSPYMEVARYRGRWFLRDGYHRSYRLLKQSVHLVPCVVVYAESVAQMGAVGSRFFSQQVLFSERPPMVSDFMDQELTLRYCRALPQQVTPITEQLLQEPVAACER